MPQLLARLHPRQQQVRILRLQLHSSQLSPVRFQYLAVHDLLKRLYPDERDLQQPELRCLLHLRLSLGNLHLPSVLVPWNWRHLHQLQRRVQDLLSAGLHIMRPGFLLQRGELPALLQQLPPLLFGCSVQPMRLLLLLEGRGLRPDEHLQSSGLVFAHCTGLPVPSRVSEVHLYFIGASRV